MGTFFFLSQKIRNPQNTQVVLLSPHEVAELVKETGKTPRNVWLL